MTPAKTKRIFEAYQGSVSRQARKNTGWVTEHDIKDEDVLRLKAVMMALLTYVDGQILDALEQAFEHEEEAIPEQ